MREIYVNLKRFDVPKMYGGICPEVNPERWIRTTIKKTVEMELGLIEGVELTYFVPEALLHPAQEALSCLPVQMIGNFKLGCQGVYREDVKEGGNFGAFTTNRPAASMKAMGIDWAMVGHSEERKDKLSLLAMHDGRINTEREEYRTASNVVDQVLNEEVLCALNRGMNVLFCVGETAQQKGADDPKEYAPRVKEVLRDQIRQGLKGIRDFLKGCRVSVGYEPIWAIGPGKIPPNGDYVAFVSSWIKEISQQEFGIELPVVYGGGLREENAAEMAAVQSLDGGLVALTKFTDPIAFDVESLKKIIEAYI